MGSNTIQAVRGMKDLLPEQTSLWQHVEDTLSTVFTSYAYKEIRLPIVERTELFSRTIGVETDIVAKEMYTFADRNGDSLSLRPEGTAGCVRAGIENGLFHRAQHRVWYMGPMFRYERPQRGRYREFHQAGVEAFGWAGPDIDLELIAMSARIFSALDLEPPELQINSLASTQARAAYRTQLVDYLRDHKDKLDADSQQRLEMNPLRILDSKDTDTQALLEKAPNIRSAWDPESAQHFEELCEGLQTLGIAYTLNPRLVRGLDYYNRTVFEWVSPHLGAQGTICAGGRYDDLVQQLGYKHPVPAIGFAIGLERLIELLSQKGMDTSAAPDAYIVMHGKGAREFAMQVAEALRDVKFNIQWHCGDESLKSQLKRADKSGAKAAIIIGEDEVRAQSVTIKPLRSEQQQTKLSKTKLVEQFAAYLS